MGIRIRRQPKDMDRNISSVKTMHRASGVCSESDIASVDTKQRKSESTLSLNANLSDDHQCNKGFMQIRDFFFRRKRGSKGDTTDVSPNAEIVKCNNLESTKNLKHGKTSRKKKRESYNEMEGNLGPESTGVSDRR